MQLVQYWSQKRINREIGDKMTNVGFRIYTTVNRTDQKIVNMLKDIDVSTIADVMNKIASANSSIKPMNSVKLLGTAITVKAPIGDNLMFKYAIEMAQAGDIIVVDGGGCVERAICGENMAYEAKLKGINGFLIDGAIRDSDSISKLTDFSVFARGSQANSSFKGIGPGEINVPVSIGGMVVYPGDIIIGDRDGVIAIQSKDADEVAKAAIELDRKEKETLEKIKRRELDNSWVKEVLNEKGCKFIDKEWNED